MGSGPGSGFDRRALEAPALGWFGGTFDPVHRGHLHVARTALAARGLDHLLWVPARRSPHKADQRPTPARERAHMVELALADEAAAGGGLERVSSLWLGEAERPGPSYTVTSLRELQAARGGAGEVFLLLGSDQLCGLDRWREVEQLLQLATPLVVLRPGADRDLLGALAGRLSPAALAALEAGFLEPPPVELAASDLRAEVRAGAAAQDLELTPRVAAYIAEHGLYGTLDEPGQPREPEAR
jgi:nicotinate-nucleotide adenylyltransferase